MQGILKSKENLRQGFTTIDIILNLKISNYENDLIIELKMQGTICRLGPALVLFWVVVKIMNASAHDRDK